MSSLHHESLHMGHVRLKNEYVPILIILSSGKNLSMKCRKYGLIPQCIHIKNLRGLWKYHCIF
jgi:hypothetical protein